MDDRLERRQVVLARVSSGSFSMRTNMVGTNWPWVILYCSMSAEVLLGVEALHHHDGAADACTASQKRNGAAW